MICNIYEHDNISENIFKQNKNHSSTIKKEKHVLWRNDVKSWCDDIMKLGKR